MNKSILALGAASALTLLMASSALAETYKVTITNNMSAELIAPVLVVATAHDGKIFHGNYVTSNAEVQVLTGDPAQLAASIGSDASVAHGNDGPPGVLLAPGKSISFSLDTEVHELRFFAMVAPTEVPDNYLTAVVDLSGGMMDDMKDDTMSDDDMASDDDMKSDDMSDDMMHSDPIIAEFSRFDIGHDEGTKTITSVEGMGFGTIKIERMM